MQFIFRAENEAGLDWYGFLKVDTDIFEFKPPTADISVDIKYLLIWLEGRVRQVSLQSLESDTPDAVKY